MVNYGMINGLTSYGFVGIRPIIICCVICFYASALLELFIKIPHVRLETASSGVLRVIQSDFKESFQFVVIEQRSILNLIPSIAVLNFAITSMLTVAVPFLVWITLGMSSTSYGIALGLISGTTVVGGIAASMLSSKIKTKTLYRYLIVVGLSLVPVGIGFLVTSNTWL